MATGFLTPDPRLREFSDLGVVLPGALLHTYVAGSPSTPLATFSDSALTVPNTNPVVASAFGLFGPIYLTPGSGYKLVLTDASGNAIWSQDNVLIPAALTVPITVVQGGTGIIVGVSGGLPYFSGTTTIASSALLAAHGVVIGGGAGVAPLTTGAGTAGQALTSNGAAADPTFQTLGVQDRQVTLQTVVNTAVETTVYTYAVPANLLGTNKTLRVSLIGDQLNNTGGNVTCRIRAKYGATTFFDITVTAIPPGANRGALVLDLELTAANATNAQRSRGMVALYDTGEANVSGANLSVQDGVMTGVGVIVHAIDNAIAEDSTAVKNLVITFTMGSANAAEDMRCHTVYTELK